MGLYRADELMTVEGYFKHKHGAAQPDPGHENLWRLDLTGQIMQSHHFFASNFCYLADKRGDMVLMKPFVGQAILRYTLESQLRAELPGRICEVKARQLGWTVENISRILHFCLDENRRGLILVDDEDIAAEQALRLYTMLNGLPGWLQPKRKLQNLKQIAFENPNPKERLKDPGLNSSIQITVPSSFRGIGGAICVILSEYAFMQPERQAQIQTGLMSAIPNTPNTIVVIDTTPNGMDASYYPMVQEAVEENPRWCKKIENWKGELDAQDVLDGILGLPDSVAKGYPGVYIPAVCPWRLHPEYSARSKTTPLGELRPMTKAQIGEMETTLGKISKYGGEEELDLRDRFDTCIERLWWRRRKIDGYKLPTEELRLLTFRQEFLSTIEGGFVDSGTAPFDRSSLDALGRMEREPAAIGLFEAENQFAWWKLNGEVKGAHRDRNPWHEIRVYAPPESGEKYTMGVDTDIAYESPDSDATVAQVVRFKDRKVVATYEARVPSHLLIEQLYCLYKWYNNCYYAIETAGIGYDLIRRCIDRGMGNVHYWKRYDADNPEPSKYPGWQTDKITRPLMDQTLTEYVCHRDPQTGKAIPLVNIPDEKTIKEIRGLTRTPSGSFKSARGHDDHVDALDIALCIAHDPYSGLSANESAKQRALQRKEFETDFRWYTGQCSSRNRPDLAHL